MANSHSVKNISEPSFMSYFFIPPEAYLSCLHPPPPLPLPPKPSLKVRVKLPRPFGKNLPFSIRKRPLKEIINWWDKIDLGHDYLIPRDEFDTWLKSQGFTGVPSRDEFYEDPFFDDFYEEEEKEKEKEEKKKYVSLLCEDETLDDVDARSDEVDDFLFMLEKSRCTMDGGHLVQKESSSPFLFPKTPYLPFP